MDTPLAFFKFVAKASLNCCLFGVGGDFVVEVLPNMAHDVWKWWSKGRSVEQLRAEVLALGQLPADQARQQVAQAVAEEAGRQPEAVRQALTAYLVQVPAAVRSASRRPTDPTGRTVPPELPLGKADDLLSLLPARTPRFQPGARPAGIGDWELVELLGVGGFGEVWKAKNPHLNEPVALKFCTDAAAARVLRNEAAMVVQVLAQVMTQGKHAGIVQLRHTYLNADPPCLEYEYVAGGDLAGLIGQWHRSPTPKLADQATRLMHNLTSIIAFAHEQGIVHRDLKPANILLQPTAKGTVVLRVADFGIGGVAARRAAEMTHTGTTSGRFQVESPRGSHTPLYASPQQMRGGLPDPRDDVHALGVIWYQLLTGDLQSAPTGLWMDDLQELGMSREFVRLLGACVAKPEKRHPNAGVLLRDGLAELLPVSVKEPEPGIDPAMVQVKEVTVPRPQVALRAEILPPEPKTTLPPVPEAVRALEGQLLALQQALRELEADTHPSLTPSREAVQFARDQWEKLRDDLKTNVPALTTEQQAQLTAKVAQDPKGQLSVLLDLARERSPRELLPYLHRLRNTERARMALLSAEEQYSALRTVEVRELRQQAADLPRRLAEAQEADLEAVLRRFFEQTNSRDDFPVQAWLALEPQLEQRRYRYTAHELFKKAEAAHTDWMRGLPIAQVTGAAGEITNSIGMEFVLIPAGKFLMGTSGQSNGEGPQHEVEISKFCLGIVPVTQEQYQRVMGNNPSWFSATGSGKDMVVKKGWFSSEPLDTRSFPVECVSWEEAVAFCKKLSELPEEKSKKRLYRLPTEAEWEYSCRGGASSTNIYPFGNSITDKNANFNQNLGRTCPVGSYPANAFGLHDMIGNVWEWCADWYDANYYSQSPK